MPISSLNHCLIDLLFNLTNCFLQPTQQVNIFQGLWKNPIFMAVLFITSALQCVMVELGGQAMHVVEGGLPAKYWAMSVGIGALSLPVQQLINIVFEILKKRYGW